MYIFSDRLPLKLAGFHSKSRCWRENLTEDGLGSQKSLRYQCTLFFCFLHVCVVQTQEGRGHRLKPQKQTGSNSSMYLKNLFFHFFIEILQLYKFLCFPLFQNLNRRGAPGGTKKEGQRSENRHKNRVKHLVPCELLVQVQNLFTPGACSSRWTRLTRTFYSYVELENVARIVEVVMHM